MESFVSQDNQDRYLETNVFKGFRNGVFVDVGAHDGVTINNTLFFERHRDWTGICVEPLPDIFEKLKSNRKCMTLQYAIDTNDGVTEFVRNTGYTEMLSGILSYYDRRHENRKNREIRQMGGTSSLIKVSTKKLSTIFDEHEVDHVHYLSVDVEGGEFAVIKSIDFDKVFIDVIDFENNYGDVSQPIVKYLTERGYILLGYKGLDIMMIHKDSVFNQ